MSCKNGGYVIRRHNRLRDLFGELLDQVASEVLIEPPLEPLTGELLPSGTKTADDARLDIAARGFWQEYEMAYFDVKVFNPYAKSYMSQNLEAAFKMGENSKKRATPESYALNMARSHPWCSLLAVETGSRLVRSSRS